MSAAKKKSLLRKGRKIPLQALTNGKKLCWKDILNQVFRPKQKKNTEIMMTLAGIL